MNRALSAPAAQFLRAHAESPVELDVLLLLVADADRWWSGEDLAAALSAPADLVVTILDGLAVANLLDVRCGSDVVYRFAPLDDVGSLTREIDALRRADRRALYSVLEEDV